MMSPAVILLVGAIAATPAAWSQDGSGTSPIVLNIAYVDGRTVSHVVGNLARSAWTPKFVTVGTWHSPEGLTVAALDYRYRLDQSVVRVDISVLLGRPHQKALPVATVVVSPDEPVRIDQLIEFGVEPVVLSIGSFVPSTLYQPAVENKTAALQIEEIEIVTSPSPGYRVIVRNYSSKPVMTFYIVTYEGGRRRSSVRQGYRDGTPVLVPGGTFSFHVDAGRTGDLVGLNGLMFEDGGVEGDAEGVHLTRVIYLGRRLQLQRVLELLVPGPRGVIDPAGTIVSLSAQVEVLSVLPDAAARQIAAGLLPPEGPFTSAEAIAGALSAALREVRDGVRGDLESAPREAVEFERWLREITALYRKWHLRFIELTSH